MTALSSGKIWILVPDWSRLKSSEPKAGDVTRKIGPLYFKWKHDNKPNIMRLLHNVLHSLKTEYVAFFRFSLTDNNYKIGREKKPVTS